MSKVIPIKGNDPWGNAPIPEGYEITPDGVFQVDKKNKSTEKLAGPVWVSAFTEDDHSGVHGVVIRWINRKGKERERAFSADILHEQGKGLAQRLARNGLAIVPTKEQQLSRYLGSFDSDTSPWIRSAPRVGWLDSVDGRIVYVLPNSDRGIIAANQDERVIFQPEQHSPTVTTMYPQGGLADWKTHVVQPCRGNPFLIFSICLALAGPLLKAAKTETGGIHFYGRTSRGKTTAAQVAASVFGCGADPSDAAEHAYVQKWNTTVNGLEALSAAHNDGLLVLDEIHTCDSKDFGSVVYNLFGGRGKTRLDKSAELKQQRAWRILVLSTGEKSSRQKIEEEGHRKAYAGQLLRLLDIPTHDEIITNPHGMDAGSFALQLKRACGKYFGTAGPAFIEAIVQRFSNTSALSAVVMRELDACEKQLTPPEAEPEQRRAIRRLALVMAAGRLACELGILSFNQDETDNAVHAVTKAWLADGANLPDSARGMQNVQAFILRNAVRFRHAGRDDNEVRDLAGYIDDNLYLFTEGGFYEACGGNDVKEVARELYKRDLLFKNETDRLVSRHQVTQHGNIKRMRFFAVKDSILEYDFTDNA